MAGVEELKAMLAEVPPVYLVVWTVIGLYAVSLLLRALEKLTSKPPVILTWPLLGGFLKFIEVPTPPHLFTRTSQRSALAVTASTNASRWSQMPTPIANSRRLLAA